MQVLYAYYSDPSYHKKYGTLLMSSMMTTVLFLGLFSPSLLPLVHAVSITLPVCWSINRSDTRDLWPEVMLHVSTVVCTVLDCVLAAVHYRLGCTTMLLWLALTVHIYRTPLHAVKTD